MRTFKRYFKIVRQEDDQPTIQNPFFHLTGDGFWHLVPVPGEPKSFNAAMFRTAVETPETRAQWFPAGSHRLQCIASERPIDPGEY